MTYREIQNEFFTRLDSRYPKSELTAIWNYCRDYLLNVDRKFVVTNPEDKLSSGNEKQMEEAIVQLLNMEPIQYIIGKARFCNLDFMVNPFVLIPRPETEELVLKVCETIKEKPWRVLDIGTGCGCIAISIKKEKPHCIMSGVDISEEALSIAKANDLRIFGKETIFFRKADILNDNFASGFDSKFDIVVSNPPYIPTSEKASIPDNVLHFEPHIALFCDDDPLLFYKAIAKHSKQLLTPGGFLFFETHENFSKNVQSLLIEENFEETEVFNDFRDKERMIKTRMKL